MICDLYGHSSTGASSVPSVGVTVSDSRWKTEREDYRQEIERGELLSFSDRAGIGKIAFAKAESSISLLNFKHNSGG